MFCTFHSEKFHTTHTLSLSHVSHLTTQKDKTHLTDSKKNRRTPKKEDKTPKTANDEAQMRYTDQPLQNYAKPNNVII